MVNKRVLEALAIGGSFDTLVSVNRANFFKQNNNQTFIESVIQFRSQFLKNNDTYIAPSGAPVEWVKEEPKLIDLIN